MNPYYVPSTVGDLPRDYDKTHYLLARPSITPDIEPMYKPIKENLKRLTLPRGMSWMTMSKVEIETLLQLNLWNLGLVWFYRDFSQVTFQ